MSGRTEEHAGARSGQSPDGARLTVTRSGEIRSVDAGAALLLGSPDFEGQHLSTLAESGRLPDGPGPLLDAGRTGLDAQTEVQDHEPTEPQEPGPIEARVRPVPDAPARPVVVAVDGPDDSGPAELRLAERGLPSESGDLLDSLEAGTAALRGATDADEVYGALAAAVVETLGVTGVDLRKADAGRSTLERVGPSVGPAVDDRDAIEGTESPYAAVWPAGETLAADEVVDGIDPGYDGVVLIPIGTHGVLAAGRVGARISGADVDALQILVDHASSALNAVRHRETIESQRASLRRYETLVESIPDPVYATDERGQVTFVNRAFERLFGYDPTEGSLHFSEFTTPESAARFREEISDLVAEADRSYGEVDVTGVAEDGRQRTLDASMGVIDHESDFEGVAGVLRDVTLRERREEVSTVLQRALRHNLRTSINVIDAHVETAAEALDDDSADHLAVITEETAWLLKLGETLRSLQQAIDPGPEAEASAPAREVIDPIVADYDDRFPEATVEANYAVDAQVPGKAVLSHALASVVENGIVHNDSDEPEVTVWVANGPETGWIDIHVEDNGPGIPPGEREILLGEAEITQLQHGSGIGLWITRWIVDALDGELLIETDDGTVVTLRFHGAPS